MIVVFGFKHYTRCRYKQNTLSPYSPTLSFVMKSWNLQFIECLVADSPVLNQGRSRGHFCARGRLYPDLWFSPLDVSTRCLEHLCLAHPTEHAALHAAHVFCLLLEVRFECTENFVEPSFETGEAVLNRLDDELLRLVILMTPLLILWGIPKALSRGL